MRSQPFKNTINLLTIAVLLAMVGCSDEIVPIEQVDRSALDSLETSISVISDELFLAKTTEKELIRRVDSLNKALQAAQAPTNLNPDVHYTVQVTDGSLGYATGARTTSLSNVVVTVNQGNVQKEITTDESGFVSFPELESGFISVTVEIAGYSNAYLIVDLRDSGNDSDGTNASTRYASTQVVVFPTEGSSMFTISGRSYYNQDLDNQRTGDQDDPFHPYTGPEIYETVSSGVSFLVDCIPSTIPNNTTRPGKIIDVVYGGLTRLGTTDQNGDWTITLPVVLLTNGTGLLDYDGPYSGDHIEGTRTSSTGNTKEIWSAGDFYPNGLSEIQIFPGGNSIQDLYYFPI